MATTIKDLLIGIGFTVDESSVKNIENKVTSLKSRLVQGLSFLGLAFGIKEALQMTDAFKEVESRVLLTTKSAKEHKEVLAGIYKIAQDTRQSYTSTADLYAKVARNANALGINQKEVLSFTQDINKALIIGGGSKASTDAALVQLGQALASGELRGDELNSILEQAPRLANAISDGMNVPLGKLREMGKNGELSAKDIFTAIRSQTGKLKAEFEKMPITMGQATTVLTNSIGQFISKVDKTLGLSNFLAKNLRDIGFFIDDITNDMPKLIRYLIRILAIITTLYLYSKRMAFAAAFTKGAGALLGIIRYLKTMHLMLGGVKMFLPLIAKGIMGMGLALKTTGIAIILMAVMFVLEDIFYWIVGGKSVIGEWLGSFDEFSKKAVNAMKPVIDTVKSIIEWVEKAISYLKTLYNNYKERQKEKQESYYKEWLEENNSNRPQNYDPNGFDSYDDFNLFNTPKISPSNVVATRNNNIKVDAGGVNIAAINVKSADEGVSMVGQIQNKATINLTNAMANSVGGGHGD